MAVAALVVSVAPSTAAAQEEADPRVGLEPGWLDAETAVWNLELQAHHDRPPGFFDPANPGNFGVLTSDMAFAGDHAFVGNFHGFNIYDISDPASPVNVTNVVCPGGQGDVSVHGDLLFMSVEETRARVDCGTDPTVGTRFQGVRIFDISDIANPVQVAAVQTCRGSHTHSLLADPDDSENVYVYVSGTANPQPATTMAGCNNNPPDGEDPSLNWGPTPITDACHDITTFPEIGLAAGACEGNGILIDISDPENPVRIDEVADPNFAYWHSATLSNDGTKVVFTDEWGGGTQPLPVPQTTQESPLVMGDHEVEEETLELVPLRSLERCELVSGRHARHEVVLLVVGVRDVLTTGGEPLLDQLELRFLRHGDPLGEQRQILALRASLDERGPARGGRSCPA